MYVEMIVDEPGKPVHQLRLRVAQMLVLDDHGNPLAVVSRVKDDVAFVSRQGDEEFAEVLRNLGVSRLAGVCRVLEAPAHPGGRGVIA